MNIIQKEIHNRRADIEASMKHIFKTNMKITDWDVPEADDREAAKMIVDIFQETLDQIREDVRAGKYDYY